MTKIITSDDIVAQARTWGKTKYHHQGRLKKSSRGKGGVDCIGLIVGVIAELKMRDTSGKMPLASYDISGYSPTPDGYTLQNEMDKHFDRITKGEEKAGDIMLFRFHSNPQHVGFITKMADELLGIIHCHASSRFVVEHHYDETWRDLSVQAYRFKKEHLFIRE